MLSEVQREQWDGPGVVDSDRKLPKATAVWGKGQTLRRSHYFVRATCKQEEMDSKESGYKSVKTE